MAEPKGDFSPALVEKIKGFLGRYETRRSSILPILHAIQDEKDWVSDADIETLESEFGLAAVDVREVLTFYSMYRKEPPAPWRFEVCNSISCWLMGSEKTLKAIEARLAEARAAGKELPFSCREVECLGLCGKAPVGFINKDRQECVTPERALELIEEYAAKPMPAAAQRCAELKAANGKKSLPEA